MTMISMQICMIIVSERNKDKLFLEQLVYKSNEIINININRSFKNQDIILSI